MHLKALEVHGFKSFPDKINIGFNEGITAIVGPNGSGKSNIADAVRWVMGEQSTKTLRGTKMEDVVFDGTQDRKPLGFAEVSLTIDNSDGRLASEYTEVTVTRRYFRSGESEYYLNKVPVRLKDINEIFMDTGLGRDGYSIIGQGRIAEILSVKSEDRRQIFEEAAGISKYRYRKAEAERKLVATEDNLVRLKDIVLELEERIEPLKEQAQKAKSYLDLREEKKGLEVNIWLDGIDKIKDGMVKLEADCANSHRLLEEADNKLNQTESEIDKSFEQTRQNTAAIDNLRNDIKVIEEEASNKDARSAVLSNDLLHNEDRISRIKNDLQNEDNRVLEIEQQIGARETSILLLNKSVSALEEQLNEILLESERANRSTEEFSEQIEALRQEISQKASVLTDLKIKESGLSAEIVAAKEHSATMGSEKEELTDKLNSSKEERGECAQKIAELEQKQSSMSNIINGYTLKLTTKEEKANKYRQKYEQLRQKHNEKTSRATMLSDMEKHFEGFFGSVRSVMDEAKRGGLRGILGPVSALIKVKDEHSLAVETALGNAIQNIVVNSEEDAKAAIYFLKSSGAGRATFLPLSSIKGSMITESEVASANGFIGIASELIENEKKYDEVIRSLLGRTVIVEHIDNAIALAKKTNYRFRIVTLDGQQLNAGGSMTGGSIAKNVGVLSRSNEIERLTKEAEEIKKELDTIETELKAGEAELSQAKAYLEGANAEYRVIEDELIKERTSLSHFEILIDGISKSLESSLKEQEENSAKILTSQSTLEEIKLLIQSGENEEKQVEGKLLDLTGSKGNLAEEKERLNNAISDKRLEIISVKKDIEAALSAIEELKIQKTEQFNSKERKLEEIKEVEGLRAAIHNEIEALKAEAAALRNKTLEYQANIEKLIADREAAEKRVTDLRQKEREAIEYKNKLAVEVQRLENKKANVETEYDELIAKLWEEYELTFSEADLLRSPIESVPKANKRVNDIKSAIKALGDVNIGAIEEFKQVKERYEFLSVQVNDLIKSKTELEKIVADLTEQMRGIFSEQFKEINAHFNTTFKELFGGGTAQLILSDPTDVLASGIEINVAPPGKIIKHLSSLSGGEQAFVAIALYFAILRVRPTPFCVLDEIEAALDDVNVVRFADYLRRLTGNTQFIAITHRRGTMEEADTLYGVTMQEKGVSKMLTINVSEIEKHLKI